MIAMKRRLDSGSSGECRCNRAGSMRLLFQSIAGCYIPHERRGSLHYKSHKKQM